MDRLYTCSTHVVMYRMFFIQDISSLMASISTNQKFAYVCHDSALVKHLGLFDLVKDILNDPDEGIRLSG